MKCYYPGNNYLKNISCTVQSGFSNAIELCPFLETAGNKSMSREKIAPTEPKTAVKANQYSGDKLGYISMAVITEMNWNM